MRTRIPLSFDFLSQVAENQAVSQEAVFFCASAGESEISVAREHLPVSDGQRAKGGLAVAQASGVEQDHGLGQACGGCGTVGSQAVFHRDMGMAEDDQIGGARGTVGGEESQPALDLVVVAVGQEDADPRKGEELLLPGLQQGIVHDEGRGDPVAVAPHRPKGAVEIAIGQIPQAVSREEDAVGLDSTDGRPKAVGTTVGVGQDEQGCVGHRSLLPWGG